MSNARSGPPLFTVVVFWAFVFGGLAFGVIFVGNWRVLAARMNAETPTGAPPPVVKLGAGPVSVNVPSALTGAGRAKSPCCGCSACDVI